MFEAMKNGNFSSWPGLTEHAVEKHLSKSTSTQNLYISSTASERIVDTLSSFHTIIKCHSYRQPTD
jgi:hypothetical protein